MHCVKCCICSPSGVHLSITAHVSVAYALLPNWWLLLGALLQGLPEVWKNACVIFCLVPTLGSVKSRACCPAVPLFGPTWGAGCRSSCCCFKQPVMPSVAAHLQAPLSCTYMCVIAIRIGFAWEFGQDATPTI